MPLEKTVFEALADLAVSIKKQFVELILFSCPIKGWQLKFLKLPFLPKLSLKNGFQLILTRSQIIICGTFRFRVSWKLSWKS